MTVLAAALVAVGCSNHSQLERAAAVVLIDWMTDPTQSGKMKAGSLGTGAEACCTEVREPQDMQQKAAYSCCKRVAMEVGARYLTEAVGLGSHHLMDS